VLEKFAGKKRDQLSGGFQDPRDLRHCSPAIPFDERAGLARGRLVAEGRMKGRPRSALDMIAEANACIAVTDNDKDFA
jgi:predicted nucleic acid-binding protein